MCGFIESQDFGAESRCGVQQEAGELGFVAEWRGDHPMGSGPRRMSRTGQRMRPVWVGHGMGNTRRAGQGGRGGDRSVFRAPERPELKGRASGSRHLSLTWRERWGERRREAASPHPNAETDCLELGVSNSYLLSSKI